MRDRRRADLLRGVETRAGCPPAVGDVWPARDLAPHRDGAWPVELPVRRTSGPFARTRDGGVTRGRYGRSAAHREPLVGPRPGDVSVLRAAARAGSIPARRHAWPPSQCCARCGPIARSFRHSILGDAVRRRLSVGRGGDDRLGGAILRRLGRPAELQARTGVLLAIPAARGGGGSPPADLRSRAGPSVPSRPPRPLRSPPWVWPPPGRGEAPRRGGPTP